MGNSSSNHGTVSYEALFFVSITVCILELVVIRYYWLKSKHLQENYHQLVIRNNTVDLQPLADVEAQQQQPPPLNTPKSKTTG
jgi:hypothetical protein